MRFRVSKILPWFGVITVSETFALTLAIAPAPALALTLALTLALALPGQAEAWLDETCAALRAALDQLQRWLLPEVLLCLAPPEPEAEPEAEP